LEGKTCEPKCKGIVDALTGESTPLVVQNKWQCVKQGRNEVLQPLYPPFYPKCHDKVLTFHKREATWATLRFTLEAKDGAKARKLWTDFPKYQVFVQVKKYRRKLLISSIPRLKII
jgi:hypothetical protein